ncbi:MAG: response regulator [Nitrospirae bacterium]|nr:response regulator [Nitrospirota bacterium]
MSYRVMIIDDDESTHEVLGQYLRLSGYSVMDAMNALEGLSMLEETPPDLVLLDVQMPEMDGFQAMELIRRDKGLRDIPVIFLTSLDRYNLKVKGLELGAEDYVVKPFNKAELMARVKAALRRSSRYRRIEGAMEGRLSDISLSELLQTLEMGRKTARINLKDMDGDVYLADGMLAGARQGASRGAQAMYRLLYLESGSFAVFFDTAPPERGDGPESVQSLLMGAVTYVDELKLVLSVFPPGSPVVEAVKGASLPAGLAALAGMLPAPLADVAVLMEGDLKDNASLLADAYRDGLIKLAA